MRGKHVTCKYKLHRTIGLIQLQGVGAVQISNNTTRGVKKQPQQSPHKRSVPGPSTGRLRAAADDRPGAMVAMHGRRPVAPIGPCDGRRQRGASPWADGSAQVCGATRRLHPQKRSHDRGYQPNRSVMSGRENSNHSSQYQSPGPNQLSKVSNLG